MINRKAARAQLKMLIDATGLFAVVSEGDPKNTGGASPICAIRDRKVRRSRVIADTSDELFGYEIVTAVVRSGANAGTEKQVEDTLADLEMAIATLVDTHPVLAGYWRDLAYDEQGTETSYDVIDGFQYRGEVIPITLVSEP